jgi:glycosyltransferase involved in cell wall biosynthesis
MRICYITMQFPATSEAFAASDLRALRRLGATLSIHSLRPAHPRAARLLNEYGLTEVAHTHNSLVASLAGAGLALRRPIVLLQMIGWIVARCWRNPDHLLRSLVLLPRVFQIVESIRRERPDLVHLFWGHYPALVGHLVRRQMPGMVLSTFLGAYDLTWNYGGTPPVARAASVVWTHARENLPAIRRLGVEEQRIGFSYRGVELRLFEGNSRQKVARRIVSASRLIPAKAVSDLLRVFALVLEDWPDASLVLLGDGPERAQLEALAAELGVEHAVEFRGHVSHETVRAEMAAAQVFLLMSRNESERLPNVVKEAICSRCLCIVTESPGIGELLQHGVHGYVVEQGDLQAAARRIGEVFNGEVMVEEMTAAAYDHVRTHFDVERNMARYLERWEELRRTASPPRGATRSGVAEPAELDDDGGPDRRSRRVPYAERANR